MRISDWSSDVCSSDLGVGRLPRKHDSEDPALHRAQMHHVAVTRDCTLSRVVGEAATHSHTLRLRAATLQPSGAVHWSASGNSMVSSGPSLAKSIEIPALIVHNSPQKTPSPEQDPKK